LSQELFNGSASNSSVYVTYNQSLILNDQFEIDHAAVDREGAPWLTATYIAYLITTNMGMTSTLVYMLLWNWAELKSAWSWCSVATIKKAINPREWLSMAKETPEQRLQRKEDDPDLDPHYKLMMKNGYKEVPHWWWFAVLAASWIVSIACLYVMKVSAFLLPRILGMPLNLLQSTLPWWGLILATVFTFLFTLFFGMIPPRIQATSVASNHG
jgi:OPT oligopeptide transporter protein